MILCIQLSDGHITTQRVISWVFHSPPIMREETVRREGCLLTEAHAIENGLTVFADCVDIVTL